MSSFNPYHAWLGLKPQIKNPHHFQLLGLPSSVSDPAEIRRAAKSRLELLNQVDPGEHALLRDALRKKIELAAKVLSNPESRVAYSRKLLEVAGKQKRKSAVAPSEIDSDSQPVPLPVDKPGDGNEVAPIHSAPTVFHTIEIPTEPGAGDGLAIPMAVPISDASTKPLEAPVAIPMESMENRLPVTAPEPIRISPIARKKNSLLLPVMSLLFFAIGVTGLVLLIVNFNAIFGRPDFSTALPALPEIPSTAGDAETPADIYLPNTSALPAGDNDHGKLPEPSNTSNPSNELSVQEDPAAIIEVSFNDEVRLRRRLSAARGRLLNRQPQAAMKWIDEAEAIVGQLKEASPPQGQASEKHQFLFDQIQATKDVNQLLSGFWAQVYQSSQKLGGGQQLKVGETYVALVSVTDNRIRVKTSGSTIDYRFQDIPSALAIAIVESTDRDDQPLWRMQKAALYAVHTEEDPVNRQNALDLVVRSEADNHNGNSIRNFLNFDPKKYGIPAQPINTRNGDNQLQKRIDEIRTLLGIGNDQLPLDKNSAEAAIAKADRMLDSVDGENALERATILRLLQELAIVAGQVDQAFEYAQESTVWNHKMEEVDKIAILTQLADSELDPENARRWIQMCLAAYKSNEIGSVQREKADALLSKARRLAEKQGWTDLMVSIQRLVD